MSERGFIPIFYPVTKASDEAEWHRLRMTGIGSSDAPAVCGVNPFSGALSIWLDKMGQAAPRETNEAMEIGEWMEDTIAEMFSKRTGYRVTTPGGMLRHPIHTFMLADVDKWMEDDSGATGVLEIKNVGPRMEKYWADGAVPDYVQVQVQHQLCVSDKDYAPVRIERNEAVIDWLIEIEGKFWNLVETGTAPPIDDSEDAEKVLKFLYPTSEAGETVELGEKMKNIYNNLIQTKRALKLLEEEERLYSNQLKDFMKTAEAAYLPGDTKPAITYKGSTSRRLDTTRLAREQAELVAAYYVESSARRFLVKGIDE
jgi:putative phage-type endonuclease